MSVVRKYVALIHSDLPEGAQMPEGAEDTITNALIAAEDTANHALADGLKLKFVDYEG